MICIIQEPERNMDEDFWLPPPPHGGMSHSSSELEFRRFLQEAFSGVPNGPIESVAHNCDGVAGIDFGDYIPVKNTATVAEALLPERRDSTPVESEDYQSYLKSRLEFECRAVALIREKNSEVHQDSVAATTLQLSPPEGGGGGGSQQDSNSSSSAQYEEASNVVIMSEKSEANDYNSESPTDPKRMRRKVMNIESARRSRKKRQDQRADLEASVAQLAEEKSDLLKQLTDMIQKSNQEAADKKSLRPQVDQLRSQVRMLEERVGKLPFMRDAMQRTVQGQSQRNSPATQNQINHHQLISHNNSVPFPNEFLIRSSRS